jgi:hypothetical protein
MRNSEKPPALFVVLGLSVPLLEATVPLFPTVISGIAEYTPDADAEWLGPPVLSLALLDSLRIVLLTISLRQNDLISMGGYLGLGLLESIFMNFVWMKFTE